MAGARTPQRDVDDLSGHRARMMTRLRRGRPEEFADYEALEMILYFAVPRRDTKQIAKRLLRRFGSLSRCLEADRALLAEERFVGDRVADLFASVNALSIARARAALCNSPSTKENRAKGNDDKIHVGDSLAVWNDLLRYCFFLAGGKRREELHVIFLDVHDRLIASKRQQTGIADHTPVYVEEVVRDALNNAAKGVVLLHNHPSDKVFPSRPDRAITARVWEALTSVNIRLRDHVIVGDKNFFSFAGGKMLTGELLTDADAAESILLREAKPRIAPAA